mgnify:CR=1 FL=1
MDLFDFAVKPPIAAVCFVLALLTPARAQMVSPSPAPTPTSSTTVLVNGQLLAFQNNYVVLSDGDALRLDAHAQMSGYAPVPGRFVLVTVDRVSKRVVSVQVGLRPYRDGIAIESLARDYVVADPRSARTAAPVNTAGNGQAVTLTITVEVPTNTPSTDAIYFSSDRSNWAIAEARMDQIDGLHWRLVLPLPDGTTLHYKFSRGSYATIERDRAGADVPARTVVAHKGTTTHDVVLRWADKS